MNHHTRFHVSAEGAALKERFLKLKIGEVLADAEVNNIIGGNWRDRAHVVATARRHAVAESVVVERVTNVGWKRLSDSEIVETGTHNQGRIRRLARRSLRIVTAASDEGLTQEQKAQRNMHQACLGTIVFMSEPAQQKRMLKQSETTKLEIGDTLRLFAK